MDKFTDLTGMKFGRLMVIKRVTNSKAGSVMFLCRCECEEEVTVRSGSLKNGHTKSCGCLQKELLLSRSMTHGMKDTKLYGIWGAMRRRCNNKSLHNYKNYGGRGITICSEWNDFQNFYDWSMENGYTEGLSIDRIDNDGDYYPENCRWSTYTEQARNRRSNRILELNGEKKCMAEWAEKLDIDIRTLFARLKAGWSVEKILTTPVQIQYRKKKKKKD